MSEPKTSEVKNVERVENVTIRFAGDSGDGMQLTGSQFTQTTAIFGNDLATLPDYPSEIRAPAGSLAGVSSFQLQFSSNDIHTPGDEPDVLVAMNPAALKVHLSDLRKNGTIIINRANFTKRNLELATWDIDPLEKGGILDGYKLIDVDMNELVAKALSELGLPKKIMMRSTNMFALGLLYWMYDRSKTPTYKFLESKFAKRPEVIEANKLALDAGYIYAQNVQAIPIRFDVSKAALPKGSYRNVVGNQATAMGLLAASEKTGLRLVYGTYPITPASDILHELAKYKAHGVITFQAEDEIAGIASAIGASFAGALAATGTSGPGMSLKSEALGLALMAELPLVIVNVQRGGPSTGMPTKTEQSDLFQAFYGRHGEAPLVVLAAITPSDCFDMAFEAARIALEHMIPVILLTDNYLANGSEPWKFPALADMPEIKFSQVKANTENFNSFEIINEETMARGWAIPGTPGLAHRIGGLEKDAITGGVSGDFDNHEYMTHRRQAKVDIIANRIPEQDVFGDEDAELLVMGWGSTYGPILGAVNRVRAAGHKVAHAQLRYLNPFPKNLGDLLKKYPNILVPELNNGQLVYLLRSKYMVDCLAYSKIDGRPFRVSQIEDRILETLEEIKNVS